MVGQLIKWSAFLETDNPGSPHFGKRPRWLEYGSKGNARWAFMRVGRLQLRIWWGGHD